MRMMVGEGRSGEAQEFIVQYVPTDFQPDSDVKGVLEEINK